MKDPALQRTPSNSRVGGLVVPTNIGLSADEVRTLLSRFATLDRVQENLKKMGLEVDSNRPSSAPTPITAEVLNDTNSREYNRVYAEQLAWYNYLTPLYAQAKSALLQAQNQLDLVEAAETKRIIDINKNKTKSEGKLTAAEIKTEVLNDGTYQETLLEVQQCKQHELQLAAYLEVVDRNMKVVSRAIEVKRIEFDGNNREANLGRGGGHANARPIRGR